MDSRFVYDKDDKLEIIFPQEKSISLPVRIRHKGGAGSGNWGHAGRPGLHGGSAPRQGGVGYTKAVTREQWVQQAESDAPAPSEMYRWANLQELHQLFVPEAHRTEYSMDVTEDDEFYFAPPKVLDSESFVDRTYGRVVLDGNMLQAAGWKRDPSLFAEMAWRNRERQDIQQTFKRAIIKFEVTQNPTKQKLQDLQTWLDFRMERHVPVVRGEHYSEYSTSGKSHEAISLPVRIRHKGGAGSQIN